MSVVVQVPMGGATFESFAVGDVLICKANRGKLQELAYLVDALQADVNYRNQVHTSAPYTRYIRLIYTHTFGWFARRTARQRYMARQRLGSWRLYSGS